MKLNAGCGDDVREGFVLDGPNRDTTTGGFVNWLAYWFRYYSYGACERFGQDAARRYMVDGDTSANIGGCDGQRWEGVTFCDAKHDPDMDFNTRALPYATDSVDFAVCEQVIEHLHNTKWFVSELYRIVKPGGHLMLATEGLDSVPNILALMLGRVPFSLQACCGEYMEGWKRGPCNPNDTRPLNHPTRSGVRGHVRVLTFGQAKYLLRQAGFEIVEAHRWGLGHYTAFVARKPTVTP